MTINRLNQGTTNQVLVKAISGQTTNLLELQDSSGSVVSSIGPTGALGGSLVPPASGLIHIETQDFSAVSSFSFSNDVFTSEYSNYRLLYAGSASANIAVRARLRSAGSSSSASSYNFQESSFFGGSTFFGRSTSQTSFRLGQFGITAANFSTDIFNPKATLPTSFNSYNFQSQNDGVNNMYVGYFNATTSFDSLEIFPESGNITGRAILYGYKV
jgi:hypothetical protein